MFWKPPHRVCQASHRLVKHVFDRNQLVMIINALVFSEILYCSTVWSNTSGKKHLQTTIGTEFCCVHYHRNWEIQPYYARIKRPTLGSNIKENLYFCDAVLVFKCMTGQAPRYLSDQSTTRVGVTGRTTQSSQLLNIPLYKTNAGQRTFYYRIVNIWNNLDNGLKTSKSITPFKFCLKNKLITDFLNSL